MTGSRRFREYVVTTGGPTPIYGVATRPEPAASRNAGLILLNSGLLHHVGSSNFSVNVARRAAALGFLSLRYDASGIGDSPARASHADHQQRAVEECTEVLNEFGKAEGVDRFILCGLCSGAFTGFVTAQHDQRVVGVVQIAGFSFTNSAWAKRHYRARFLKPKAWSNRATRMLAGIRSTTLPNESGYLEAETSAGWTVPPRETVDASYRRLVQRRVKMLNIMTGGESYTYNYEGQFKDLFPVLSGGDFTEKLVPDASHVMAEPEPRLAVEQLILDWLAERF